MSTTETTAQVKTKAAPLPETMPAVEPLQMSQIDMLKIAPTRDERLFLVLSIFIGIISGLLVVSFRVAINWIQTLTLGSAPQAGLLRLIFVPMIMGAVVRQILALTQAKYGPDSDFTSIAKLSEEWAGVQIRG